jgi:hypothetical protein
MQRRAAHAAMMLSQVCTPQAQAIVRSILHPHALVGLTTREIWEACNEKFPNPNLPEPEFLPPPISQPHGRRKIGRKAVVIREIPQPSRPDLPIRSITWVALLLNNVP